MAAVADRSKENNFNIYLITNINQTNNLSHRRQLQDKSLLRFCELFNLLIAKGNSISF